MNRNRSQLAKLARPASERGFTLIELLVAMGIAGILISLIFAVYTRMSVAYQAQNRITAVVQNLRAGQDRLVRELRMAGDQFPQADYRPRENAGLGNHFFPNHEVPFTAIRTDATVDFNGVKVAPTVVLPGQTAGQPLQPVYITNGAAPTEPDEIRFFYADTSVAAKVAAITLNDTTLIDLMDHDPLDGIDPTAPFVRGDYVLLVNSTQEDITRDVDGSVVGNETFEITAYEACLLRVTSKNAGQLVFDDGDATYGAWNDYDVSNLTAPSHCSDVLTQHDADIARPAAARADTMIYKFIGRSYRIDPARRDVGVLQYHPFGELETPGTWLDLGIGFTNLQIASRWYDANGVDEDGVGPVDYAWYSGDNQQFPDLSTAPTRPVSAIITEMSLSLESRSFAEVDAPTALIEGYGTGEHSEVGDSPAIPLPDPDPRYNGQFVYRWSTTHFKFRNIGRGR